MKSPRPRKAGRPKLENKRRITLGVKVNGAEMDEIKSRARASGKLVSKWARDRLLE